MSDDVNVAHIAQQQAQIKAERAEAREEAAAEGFIEACAEATNPFAADKWREKMRPLQDRTRDVQKELKKDEEVQETAVFENLALEYEQKNAELPTRSLMQLLRSLSEKDNQDDILRKVLNFFPDKSIADDALEFLVRATKGPLQETVQATKDNFEKQFAREIVAGKNIALQAQDFSKQGLGSTTSLRDLYRDITGNPREPAVLFDQLSKAYSFEQLKTVIQFLLHSMGGDLRSKGPSIPRGELARLFTETRSLQAILGVYRFFQARIGLVNRLLSEAGIEVPKTLTFEVFARTFMRLLEDRYPASAKVISLADTLGLIHEALARITVISQWRDALRSISPRLFKTAKTRDELWAVIIEALETLENEEEEKK